MEEYGSRIRYAYAHAIFRYGLIYCSPGVPHCHRNRDDGGYERMMITGGRLKNIQPIVDKAVFQASQSFYRFNFVYYSTFKVARLSLFNDGTFLLKSNKNAHS